MAKAEKEMCQTTRSGNQTTASASSHSGIKARTGTNADTAELSTWRRVLVTAVRPASLPRYGHYRRGRSYTRSGHSPLCASVKLWSHSADSHVWRRGALRSLSRGPRRAEG